MTTDAEKLAGGSREYERRAEELARTMPRPLAEAIVGAMAATEKNQAAARAKLLETPEGQRIAEARELLRQRLPPFVLEHADTLRARVRHPEFKAIAANWSWSDPSVMLAGPTGLGKTTAVGLIVRRLVARAAKRGDLEWPMAKRVRWAHASDLVNARRQHPLGEDEAPRVLEAMRASLLVLDELGWESGRDCEVIREVLNKRYEAGAPTLVTTGLRPAEALERYGDAVLRRIFEAGARGRIVSGFEKARQAK